jgi:hypothetical protein
VGRDRRQRIENESRQVLPAGKKLAGGLLILFFSFGLAARSFAQTTDPEVVKCGKYIADSIETYTNGYLQAVSSCSLQNLSSPGQIDCATNSDTARAIQSANAKLLSGIQSCSTTAETAICPLQAKTIGALYNTLTRSSGSLETELLAVNTSLFTQGFTGCSRPTTAVPQAAQECAQRVAQGAEQILLAIEQCLFDCEEGNLSNNSGGLCVDLTTGAPSKGKVANCVTTAVSNLSGTLATRCTPATLTELGCPDGANSLADLTSALSLAAMGITEPLDLAIYHSDCKKSLPPPGPTPTPLATVLLTPSQTTKTIGCGETLDSNFFGTDDGLSFTSDLNCSTDTTGTNGIVITKSGVTIDGGNFSIVGPGTSRFRTGTGVLVAPGVSNVTLQAFKSINHFAIGIGDSGDNVGLVIQNLTVFRNVKSGVHLTTPGLSLTHVTADRNAIGFDLEADNIQVTLCTARRSTPAPGVGFLLAGLDTDANGIVVEVTQCTVEGNIIGMVLQGGPQDVEQNDINTNTGDGIQVAATGATVKSNSVKLNAGSGITVTGSNNTITKNRCDQNSLSGMVISGPGNKVTGNGFGSLTNNGNLQYGLLVTADGSIFNTNDAQANGLAGFEIQAATTRFKNNTSESNTGPGFEFTVGGSALNTNAAQSNAGAGFVIAPGNTDLGNNRVDSQVFSFTSAGGTFP